ncbi:hypothetical protein G6F42_026952 [Rhizopus arrhizus]|nr:hypothetical protein G6F42_026952 [Rhizopus arrhizus]
MNTSNTTSNNNLDLINLDSLDDWLESDLRQSGIILPAKPNDKPMTPVTPAQILMASPPISECTPRMDPLLELSTPKIKHLQQHKNFNRHSTIYKGTLTIKFNSTPRQATKNTTTTTTTSTANTTTQASKK